MFLWKGSSLAFLIFFIKVLYSSASRNDPCELGDPCIHSSTNTSGEAKLVTQCPSAIADIKKNIIPPHCGFHGQIQIVCCPSANGYNEGEKIVEQQGSSNFTTNNRTAVKKCKEYGEYVFINATVPIIVTSLVSGELDTVHRMSTCGSTKNSLFLGGNRPGPREFPHMALIGYGSKENPTWKCGGTIISERFILTAAHCLNSPSVGPPTFVRVGDFSDYETDRKDNLSTQIAIKTIISHPTFTRKELYNDIGLVELTVPILLSPDVRPACLHTQFDIPTTKAISTAFFVDYKEEDIFKNMYKDTVEFVSHAECNKTYEYYISKRLNKGIAEDSQLCMTSHTHDKDTCQGDTGGPLQIYSNDVFCMYNIIGVTSFGSSCAASQRPFVYTRISHYIDWIESIVWPNE